MSPFIAEFIGTMMLVLFGNGVVANVVLARTKGNDSGWLVIAAGWGIAVFIGAFCANDFSGAHLNPAVTVAMVIAGKLGVGSAITYCAGQMLGAFAGATLVFLCYREHFKVTEDKDSKLACFCTAPNIRNLPQAFFCEVLGTFALIFPIFLMITPSLIQGDAPVDTDPVLGLGSLGFLPVGLLVFGIGLSLGGTTGYAINPARDLGPRLIHALLPIPGKRDSDWGYAWIPVVGPIVGGALAAIVYKWIA
ncbi:MIP/aquaporin family protein [Novipirellula artificiosorum]|uniref:Putative glycerol uptake facilitator protein n=1 Tax=Novipirellula artificiosorum TaxID=2528016 RepID=A0A5C6DXD6_9BACT|nr:MIP/aquaporin family protein [Novipirellula artificiosorum]TWU39686.1 putative glycerol uptake facilitator protein [Novipirellula artificiosorum]